jgi:hypothetical protein
MKDFYSLGGCYLQKYQVELFIEAVDWNSTTSCSWKYLELKDFEDWSVFKLGMTSYIVTWAYTRKTLFSTIASGATPIGSAERGPDDIPW